MVKKILIGFVVLIALVFIAIITLPIIYKDDIVVMVKEQMNENLNAKADFGAFDLSMIEHFPNLSFTINDLKVENIDTFAGITLASIQEFNFTLDLMSVISGNDIKIIAINIESPKINVKVLEDGTANWDIAKASSDTTEIEEEDTSATELPLIQIKRFAIEHADIIYDDASLNMMADIKDLNYFLKGDISLDLLTVENELSIASLTYIMDGVKYLKKVNVKVDADVEIDNVNAKYTFKENEFALNGLTLGLDGWVAMPENPSEPDNAPINMDLTYKTNQTTFASILSLVPGAYTADFKDVETKGNLALSGYAKGTYDENTMPAFGLNLAIGDAMFKYPDLPMAVNNVNMDLKVNNPDGHLDHTVTDLSKFHFEIGEEPFDFTLLSKTPMSDPYIDASAKGKIDFEKMMQAYPMEEIEKLTGTLSMDFSAKGNLSTIEAERYEDFESKGNIILSGMDYASPDLAQPIFIKELKMTFNPKNVTLNNFDMTLGKSDLQMNGTLDNFIAYALADSTIKGTLNISSNLFDSNEWLEDDSTETEEEDTSALTIIEVPGNIDFVMTADMKKVLYDNMAIENIKGNLIVRNSNVRMTNVGMNILGGKVTMSGLYGTQNPTAPVFDYELDMKEMDIQESFVTFNSFKQLVPVAKSAQGTYETNMTIDGILDNEMMPVYDKLNGKGGAHVYDVVLKDLAILDKIADALKQPSWKKMTTDQFDFEFEIKDGRMYIKPYDIKLGDMNFNVKGSNGLEDYSIDYVIKAKIPRAKFGSTMGDAESALSGLTGGKMNVDLGEFVTLDIFLTGTMDDPKVNVGFKDAKKEVKEKVKEVIKEEVKKVIDKGKGEAKKKLMDEANRKANQLVAEAKKQAQNIKDEAVRANRNAKAAADKVYNDAVAKESNPFKKKLVEAAGKKIKSEAYKKADQLQTQANTKADNLVRDAQKKADGIRKAAQAEADKL